MKKLRKILFLDFDGVLNSISWILLRNQLMGPEEDLEREGRFKDFYGRLNKSKTPGITFAEREFLRDIDPNAINLLQYIVDQTQCEIVISSSWRILRKLEDFYKGFRDSFNISLPLIGMTPRIQFTGSIRGDEINEWLKTGINKDEEVVYVCVDDDSDFHPNQNLVKTSYDTGLTIVEAAEIIKRLNVKDVPS